MSTMSYCAVENTADNMETILETMELFDTPQKWYNSLNEDEKENVRPLMERIDIFLEVIETVEMN